MTPSRARAAWPATLLVVLVAAVYWPGLGGGFVFDDYPNIVDNTALHVTEWDRYAWLRAVFSSDAGVGHRPLSMATFALNHVFTGLDPVAMKLANIAIHALNACLVLGLLRTLLALAAPACDARRREWTARFAAAAWALHPINLMAVLFVVQRMESLCHVFVLGGLWLYLLGRQRQLAGATGGWWRMVAGIGGGTALGLLCKESAVLLPLYAACVECCVLDGLDGSGRRSRSLLAFFGLVLVLPAVLGLAWLLPKVGAPGAFAARDFTLGERLLTEGRVVVFGYLRWTLFPSLRTLSLYHDDIALSQGLWRPPATMVALAVLAALVAAAGVLRRRRPLVALGIAWFLVAQLLTATVIPLELVFEHRNYFASLGVAIAVADLLLLVRHDNLRRVGPFVAALWLSWCAMTTLLRAREWSDPLRFASTEAAKHPQSPRAGYEYGRLLVIATGYRPDSPVLPLAMHELERDRALPRSGILPASALLVTAARTGQPQRADWWQDIVERLRRDPVGVQETSAVASLAQCARSRACLFPPEAMLAVFQAALSHGLNAEILNIYADYALNVLRQPEAALAMWQQAIALRPDIAQYRINRAKLLIALGRDSEAREAIAQLRRAGRVGTNEEAARELEARFPRTTAK